MLPFPVRLNANLRPMFPKQTQLQNSTLAIQVPTPIVSFVILPSNPTSFDTLPALTLGDGVAGGGTISGLTPSITAVPARPTMVERRKPGFERSIRYHSTGLASASVRETWSVDCQGSFRYTVTHHQQIGAVVQK